MKKMLIVMSALVILFASCKKDKDDEPITPTVANLTGNYKISAVVEDGVNVFNNSNASLNYYDACERDDVYKLKSDMSYEMEDAGTVCSPNGSFTGGSWSLSGTIINLDGYPGTIKSWNGKTLVVEDNLGGSVTTTTLIKQ